MSYPVQIVVVFLCGAIAGLLYFSGLMFTIQRVRWVRSPGLFLTGSFMVRAVLVLAVFFAVSNGQWQKFSACLVGFLLARQVMVMLWSPAKSRKGSGIEVRKWKS